MADRPTETVHPLSAGLHRLDGAEALSRLLAAQQASLGAVQPALGAIEQAADLAAQALRAGGKMAYAGAGSSGLMALSDCLELAGTFDIPPVQTPMLFAGGTQALLHMVGSVEDDPAQARRDVVQAGLGAADVVICVSASGSTPYTLAVAEAAQAAGAVVVGLASVPGAALLRLAQVAVCLETGPEMVAGSTRMAAATAQKVALNLLSVRVGIRLGHVHDGHMINLVADNAKLALRAARIVAAVAGVDADAAHLALQATGGAVKPAILVATGFAPEAARTALAAGGGHLAGLLAPAGA